MNANGTAERMRTIEKEMQIKAPVDAVWKALTDAEELTRWFPLEARVTPGAGGAIWKSWKGHCEGDMPIEIWEPNKHLRLMWKTEVEGQPEDQAGAPAVPLAVDFHLEGRGGSTTLRLVHSGFDSDATWDETYDGTRRGWNFELRGLRHYLENHFGTPRRPVWAKSNVAVALREVWDRLMGREGLVHDGSLEGKKEGDRYAIGMATGDRLEGTVYILEPPHDFCATVDNMNKSLLRVRVDRLNGSDRQSEANLWLSCYGLSKAEVDAFEQRAGDLLRRLYPEVLKG